jgi:integrase
MLTDAMVRRLKPHGKTARVVKDHGARSLYLIIQASGSKSFLMRFARPGGKVAKLVLGSYDASGRELTGDPEIGMPLTLSAARQLAARIHRERARGIDVIADHKAEQHRRRAAVAEQGADSFAAMARAFIVEHAKVKTRHWRETARLLGLDPDSENLDAQVGGLAERWADRDVSKIDGHDVHAAVDEARRIGVPGIEARRNGLSEPRARALHAALSVLFSWLLRHRKVTVNPCAGVWRPKPPKARDRVLTDDEIRAFWKATDAMRQVAPNTRVRVLAKPFAATLKLLLLTGQRLTEISHLRRDELSHDMSQIALPGARTKNHRQHVVPLAPLAKEIIASMPLIEGCDYVFTTNAKTPISGWSKAKAALDKEMEPREPWRVHDLRRTAVTGMRSLGVPPDVVERVVNHVSGHLSGVAGVYDKSELLPERKAALEQWAARVAAVVENAPANVVSIQRRGRR